MSKKEKFIEEIKRSYTFKKDFLTLGGAVLDKETIQNTFVKIPLKTLNRHGLIAGATGTGKTKTLQILAENLSEKGIPSLLMDIKGDLSGIAMPGGGHPKITARHEAIGIPFEPEGAPVEFLTLSQDKGARLRATVSEFGPVLFSKILDLNDTQGGIVAVVFKYSDDHQLPLLDLKDFKKVLQFLTNEGKAEMEKEYGRISSASVGTILRKIIELEQQGADIFFGEPSFEVEDLLAQDEEGRGIVNIIRLTDVQDKPKLFSTFMLQLLAEIYASLPEAGDTDQPKLAVFIDEAHLVFKEATDALLDQIESIIKLIRSKGVGIFFCTQNPVDIPESVLAQLGLKIQHALRAFTAKDRKALKLAAENYPITEYYDTDQLLTELGIGEAVVSVLNEKGIPTPLVHTMLRAPKSRMDILTEEEIDDILDDSDLIEKYNNAIDRESAYEILNRKLKIAAEEELTDIDEKKEEEKEKQKSSWMSDFFSSPLAKQIGRTLTREVTRGLLGVLGIKSTRRRTYTTRRRRRRRY
jgi:DNA helicase HerA-like ATPase